MKTEHKLQMAEIGERTGKPAMAAFWRASAENTPDLLDRYDAMWREVGETIKKIQANGK